MEELLTKLKFNQDNLIPAIAQQYNSKEVLMMAWMNKESIIKTFETKKYIIGQDLVKNYGSKAKVLAIFKN